MKTSPSKQCFFYVVISLLSFLLGAGNSRRLPGNRPTRTRMAPWPAPARRAISAQTPGPPQPRELLVATATTPSFPYKGLSVYLLWRVCPLPPPRSGVRAPTRTDRCVRPTTWTTVDEGNICRNHVPIASSIGPARPVACRCTCIRTDM